MDIQAAVVRQPGGPFLQENLTLAAPQPDEVLVRIVATGLCHSDITAMHFYFPPAPPVVLGHEGAGIVDSVGANVTHVAPGDHVVLSFSSCGECANEVKRTSTGSMSWMRSEERRVGKECPSKCRSRWSPYH